MRNNPLKKLVTLQKAGQPVGIYSCCSANPYVIKAAINKAKQENCCVLIESTANQCDQYGGYTGMTPLDFKNFVLEIAHQQQFDTNKLFLGGDHLGPLTFAQYDEEKAMKEAAELIRCYVAAGFTKIHIDTSMKLASDDPDTRLSDEIIAARGAYLAKVAQDTFNEVVLKNDPEAMELVFIVGSEVPIPGGAAGEKQEGMQVTKVEDFKATYETFKKAFLKANLSQVWDNVIAFVVQPGVEEKDDGCVEYERAKATALTRALKDYPNIIFEGHSTDYQTKIKLKELVEDGIGILKVGPALTFAAREAIFALAYIEQEYLQNEKVELSNFINVLEEAMLEDPKYWSKHYFGTAEELHLKRLYSFSDRCRYYLPNKKVTASLNKLITNLRTFGLPLNLLSQFMPVQYTKVRENLLANDPEALIIDRIGNTIDEYLYATKQKELF